VSARAEALLARALAAEEEVERLGGEMEKFRRVLGNVMEGDPHTAVQALAYIKRCETAEELVRDALQIMETWDTAESRERRSVWRTRAHAAVSAMQVADRDAEGTLPDESEFWQSAAVPSIRQSLGQISRDRKRRQ
jgi:hypothetical protein